MYAAISANQAGLTSRSPKDCKGLNKSRVISAQALQGLEAACQAADTAAMIFQDVGNRPDVLRCFRANSCLEQSSQTT